MHEDGDVTMSRSEASELYLRIVQLGKGHGFSDACFLYCTLLSLPTEILKIVHKAWTASNSLGVG